MRATLTTTEVLGLLILSLAIAGPGCRVEVGQAGIPDTFTLETGPVDILWVVDNSNSMEEAQNAVGAAFPSFREALADLEVDWQLGIVTTDMNDPDHRGRLVPLMGDGGLVMSGSSPDPDNRFANRIRVGTEGSTLERGLAAAWAALTPPLSTHDNSDLRRAGARMAVIVVSDEDDCSDEGALLDESSEACAAQQAALVPTTTYIQRLGALSEAPLDTTFHALVETGVDAEFDGCGGTTPGSRYLAVARATGGFVAPLCGDLSEAMARLGDEVAGLRSAFPLLRSPDPESLVVQILPIAGTTLGPRPILEDPTRLDGWTYDPSSNALRLWGPSRPALGETVSVAYGVGLGS